MTGYIGTDTAPETLTQELAAIANAKPEQMGGLIEQYLRSIREDLLKMWDGQWRWLDDGTDLVLQFLDTTTDIWTNTNVKMTSSGALFIDSLVISKNSGKGIKVDLDSPTFGFADLLGEVFQRNTGASKPTRAAWKGNTFGFKFAAGKEEEFEFHISHDYVPGTEIFLHIHWGHNVTTITGGTVTFDYELTYAKGYGQGVFGTNAVSTIVSATATTGQYSHELSEAQVSVSGGSGTQLDTDILEPDGVIKATVGVNANNLTVSGGGVPDPFIHYIDIHYQTTGVMGTKQKAPNFYV